MAVELAEDMLTALTEPKLCVPWEGLAEGTPFQGHAYFEAPSMRHIGDWYYLVYSSQWSRELCYAVSRYPDRDFHYGGVIVDNGDMGINGRTLPVCIPGNNHGGLVQAGGKTYIFYHRHTHGTSFSRQGCAQQVEILEDGRIPQTEITSCGLNNGPLPAEGVWPAAIACHLTGNDPAYLLDFRNVDAAKIPCIFEAESGSGREQFIRNITDGTVIGYKYFQARKTRAVRLWLRGHCEGEISLCLDGSDNTPLSSVGVSLREDEWITRDIPAEWTGVHSLYFRYKGAGQLEFKQFEILC